MAIDFQEDSQGDSSGIDFQPYDQQPQPQGPPADPRGMGEFPVQSQPYGALARGALDTVMAGTSEALANKAGIASNYDPNSPQYTNPYLYATGQSLGSLLPLGKLGQVAEAGAGAVKSGVSAMLPRALEAMRIAGIYGAGNAASSASQDPNATVGSVATAAGKGAAIGAPLGLVPLGAGSIASKIISKNAPHITTSTIGDTALKPGGDSDPQSIHDLISSDASKYLNAVARPKNARDAQLNKIGYGEAFRNSPDTVDTSSGLKESAEQVADKVSNILNTVKQNTDPISYSPVSDAIKDAVSKSTLDEGQQATLDSLISKYPDGKTVDIATAINDENNANAMYQKMVLKNGMGSHEAKMYDAERSSLSDIVDKAISDSGVPNADNLGMIYRGSKNLAASIADKQLKASISTADTSKVSPLTIGAAIYGLGKVAKGVATLDPVSAIEGGALLSGATTNYLKRRNLEMLKDPDLAASRLHNEFSGKVQVSDNPTTSSGIPPLRQAVGTQSQSAQGIQSSPNVPQGLSRDQALSFLQKYGSNSKEPLPNYSSANALPPRLPDASFEQLFGPKYSTNVPLGNKAGYYPQNRLPGGLPLRPSFVPIRSQ